MRVFLLNLKAFCVVDDDKVGNTIPLHTDIFMDFHEHRKVTGGRVACIDTFSLSHFGNSNGEKAKQKKEMKYASNICRHMSPAVGYVGTFILGPIQSVDSSHEL